LRLWFPTVCAKQDLSFSGWKLLYVAQLPVYCTRPLCDIIHGIGRLIQFLLDPLESIPEFTEFSFNLPEDPPDLARLLLNGKRSKPHLKTVQNCDQSGRSRYGDATFALQTIDQPGLP